VRVWDAKTGEQLRELQGHTDYVTSVSFSPDGERIVSGSGTISAGVGCKDGRAVEGAARTHRSVSPRSHSRLMANESSLVLDDNQCGCGMQRRASS
jgi:WD40 repeat protein